MRLKKFGIINKWIIWQKIWGYNLCGSKTIHKVFISNQTNLDLTSKKISKKELVKFSFEFLLEREPNTAILSSFDLIQISKYFPEYFMELRDYCSMKI